MPKLLKTKTSLLLVLILFFSSLFRLTYLNYIEFKADESINLLLAAQPIFGKSFMPGSTVSSVGILNPPLINYLLFPLALISLDPRAVSFFIGLLNIITIGLLFLLLKRYYGIKTAFFTSALLALSPWAILYSRKIWAQDFIMIFLIPYLLSIHRLIIEKQQRYWIMYVASSLLLMQLHQTSIFFLFPLSVLLLLKIKPHVKYCLLGLVIGFIPFVPYVLYQLYNNCPDCHKILNISNQLAYQRSLQLFMRPFQILSQGNFYFVLGEDIITFSNRFPIVFQLRRLFYIEYILLPLGMVFFWKNEKKLRILVYTSLSLPFIYYIFRIEPLMHYYIVALPLLFLFLGYGISIITDIKHGKYIGMGIFLVLFLISLLFNFSFFSILQKTQRLEGDYGNTYIFTKKSIDITFKKYGNERNYHEIILTYLIPKNIILGFQPVGKMLYNNNDTQKNLKQIEDRLTSNPVDPIAYNKLLAYYTTVQPTKETLKLLEQKSIQTDIYIPIYNLAHNIYLNNNLKKFYNDASINISFEIPKHWIIEKTSKTNKKIKITGDNNYYMEIIQKESLIDINKEIPNIFFDQNNTSVESKIIINQQDIKKKECITKTKKWCGTLYYFVDIGRQKFAFFHFIKNKDMPSLDSRELKNSTINFDIFLATLDESKKY